ncbi:rhodanese-like domain-containing protein [uncultured Polaribacter sp.]|uniref:rhodanese-like domain-containing protein n=1 Tax=uncultured Polaribacter sp. TaxID=174711 RepID=UPI0037039BF5
MKNIVCLFIMIFFCINCNSQVALKAITTKELKVLLSQENIQLMDVRTPEEIKEGAIQTAFFVNYFDVDFENVATAKLNKSKPVYLYCRSGNRSGKACKILKEKGFEAINVLGGYKQWNMEKKQ